MTPKVLSWMHKRKGRKLIFKPVPGPNGGSYTVELREGVSVAVEREVSRHSVERYIGNSLRKALEEMVKEIDELTDEEDDEDDED